MTSSPGSPARQLARVVSLATRIEPELLRAARIHVVPHLGVSAEVDLWFSTLVESRTPLAIVLRADVLDDLRAELGADQAMLDRAWTVVEEMHASAPPVLHLEERLTWLGLRDRDTGDEVDALLRQAVISMVDQNRDGIARWSARAYGRLPETVKSHESARMLNVGAKARLGTRIEPGELEGAEQWLAWVLPSQDPVKIGVRLMRGAVELGPPTTEGAQLLDVPPTNPPYVELSWQRDGRQVSRHVPVPAGPATIVETGTTSVRIRTGLGQVFDLVPRRRMATERAFGLRGRIVTMDESGTVMPDGVVFIENDTIFGVQPADAPPPASFEDVEIVETRGTIYPGLIELHNHLMYDVLPLWQIDRQYTNREQWARDRAYRAAVTGPAEVLRMIPGMSNAILRFVEARCLAAGVTTTQGIDVRSKPTGVIRFADRSLDALLPSASTRITAGRADEILRRRNESACLLIHVAEGTDARARQEFLALADSLDRRVAIVHGTALGEDDLKRVAEAGAALVWSPLHDLILYGRTADVAAAAGFGVRLGLGSSWTVTGSRNLLGELKWAQAVARATNAPISDADLVASVTRVAADILGWGRLVGSIAVGKRADLVVVGRVDPDPYATLIEASEADVRLVMVDGIARAGRRELMGSLHGRLRSTDRRRRRMAVRLRVPRPDQGGGRARRPSSWRHRGAGSRGAGQPTLAGLPVRPIRTGAIRGGRIRGGGRRD